MTTIQFPTCSEMFPHFSDQKKLKQYRILLRFYSQRFLAQRQIHQLMIYLNQHSQWAAIFHQDPYRFNTLLAKFCDNRFNVQQRLTAMTDNFNVAEQKLSPSRWQQLIQEKSLVLAQLTEELTLNMDINSIDPFEGFFSINIQNQHQQHLYDASFTFLSDERLLIASIQGPRGEQAQEQVKLLTKALHGIRPMFLLVTAFKMLAMAWQVKLVGIPHTAQAKYRFNDSSRLLFNYDHFWQENNAELAENYWQIPLEIERKPLEEIASKKRSMYRKRYEMLDQLDEQIRQFIQAGKF